LLFIIHFGLTNWAVTAWNPTTTAGGGHAGDHYGPDFALAVATLPLYPFLHQSLKLLAVVALNSLLVAMILAAILVFFRWRTVLVILLLAPLVLIGGMFLGAMILARGVERAEAPPSASSNESAQHIEQIAQRFRGTNRRAVYDYLWREIARGDDRIDAPPQEVDHFLIEHRWDLDEIEQLSLGGEVPRFSPDGDLMVLFLAQKIVLVDALQSERAGDRDGAWRRVDAANRITQAMLATPQSSSTYVAVAATENQLGVARKLSPPAQLPIRKFDPNQHWIDALKLDAARMLQRRADWYTLPYVRLAAAETANSEMRGLRALQRARGCRLDRPPSTNPAAYVSFNPFGVFGDGEWLAIRGNRMLLDFEGTEKVLALKRGNVSETSACPDRRWKVEGNVLRLQPPLPPAQSPALPARHAITPASNTPS
jgi:hypothetical protein